MWPIIKYKTFIYPWSATKSMVNIKNYPSLRMLWFKKGGNSHYRLPIIRYSKEICHRKGRIKVCRKAEIRFRLKNRSSSTVWVELIREHTKQQHGHKHIHTQRHIFLVSSLRSQGTQKRISFAKNQPKKKKREKRENPIWSRKEKEIIIWLIKIKVFKTKEQ